MFAELFNKLYCIDSISSKALFKESWVNITFGGVYNSQNKSYFEEVNNELAKLNIQSSIHFFIEKNKKNFQDFIYELQDNENWELNINKNILLNKEEVYNFFYSEQKLIDWIKQTKPFNDDYPLNKNKKVNIIVNGLQDNFGGGNLIVCNSDYDFSENPSVIWNNYDETLIMNNVRILNNPNFIIKPLNHFLTFGKITKVSQYFYRNSILVLLASLCNEIHGSEDVILRGYRRISIKLGYSYIGNEISMEYQTQLSDAVKWVYQSTERCDLRLKLLLERVTLDINRSLPYVQSLFSVIQEATNQAKEMFSFIIYDRKDLYQKELKDLLKDLKILSELYSNKLRTLLSNLLRDVLAAFILIGITLFSKITEITNLFENNLIRYVFFAFGLYFILSAVFQSIVDFFDIYRSDKEFNFWKHISRGYISKKRFNLYKSKTLKARAIGTSIIYFIVILFYFAIAIVCFNFPCVWNKVVN
jgi:hypothetical protein